MIDRLRRGLTYTFVCHDKTGKLKWIQRKKNLIVDEGLNLQVNQFYLNQSWYLGLIKDTNPEVFNVGDTAAKITTVSPPNPPTTNGWTEEPNCGGRQLLAFTNTTVPGGQGVALSGALIFTYTQLSTFGGGFVVSSPDNSGVLYSVMAGTAPTIMNPGDTVTATVEFDLQRPPQ